MGTWVATIIMAMIAIVAAYNILTHGSSATGLIGASASGAGTLIAALQGR